MGDKNTQSRREINKNVLRAILNNADCHGMRTVVDLCYRVDVIGSDLQMVLIVTFQKIMSSAVQMLKPASLELGMISECLQIGVARFHAPNSLSFVWLL